MFRRLLFSISSKPIKVALKVLRIACPTIFIDATQISSSIPGRFRILKAICSEKKMRNNETMIAEVVLIILSILIILSFPSEINNAFTGKIITSSITGEKPNVNYFSLFLIIFIIFVTVLIILVIIKLGKGILTVAKSKSDSLNKKPFIK